MHCLPAGRVDTDTGERSTFHHEPAARKSTVSVNSSPTGARLSDLQADITAELIRAGIEVHVFNQRSVARILDMIGRLGAMMGARDRSGALVAGLERARETAALSDGLDELAGRIRQAAHTLRPA